MSDKSIVEVVLFRLNPGVDETEFLAASAGVELFLRGTGGFIQRELLQNEEGQWVDVVHWRSQAEAYAAAEKIMSDPRGQKFGAFIDPSSITMLHLQPRQTMAAN